MLAFLGTLATGLLALVPLTFVSRRRRVLAVLKEESAVLEVVLDPNSKAKLREAVQHTAEEYRIRVLGLDRVERAQRRWIGTAAVFFAIWLPLVVAAILTSDEEAGTSMGLDPDAALAILMTASLIGLTAMWWTIFLAHRAQAERRRNREKAQNEYEKTELVEDLRSGRLSADAYNAMIAGMRRHYGDDLTLKDAILAEQARREHDDGP